MSNLVCNGGRISKAIISCKSIWSVDNFALILDNTHIFDGLAFPHLKNIDVV